MALTRAQLLMGNSAQGFVLPGQVQAVKEGNGINILPDGTIEVDSQTVVGVMKMGQTAQRAADAYNGYNWPIGTGTVGQQLGIVSVAGGVTELVWEDADGIDWTTRGQLIASTAAGQENDTLVNIGSSRSFLMSQVDDLGNPSGLAYSDVVTSAMKVPTGIQAQRPGAPVEGELRFNSTQRKLEVWDGFEWQTIASEDPADGSFVRQLASTVAGQTDVAAIPAGTTAQRITSPAPQDGFFRFNTDPNAAYGTQGSMEFWDGANWVTVAAIAAPAGFVPQTSPIGAAVTPSGTTGQRPGSPVGGYFRYNTDQHYLEFYNSATATWELLAPAAGGVHSFVQGTTPTAFNTGDLWYDTVLQRESVWDGVAWVQPGVTQTSPTGAAVIPAGLQTQRPASPSLGAFRFNDDRDKLEFWNGTTWQEVASGNAPTPPVPATIVSSVNVSGGTTGFAFTGGPITSSGTMTMSGTLGIANGGTGATTGPAALANMGLSVNVSGGTTGFTFTGGPVTSAGTMTMSGTLGIGNGGTGGTTPATAINNLLPGQGGQAGKFLTTNGANVSWAGGGGPTYGGIGTSMLGFAGVAGPADQTPGVFPGGTTAGISSVTIIKTVLTGGSSFTEITTSAGYGGTWQWYGSTGTAGFPGQGGGTSFYYSSAIRIA
jgi:hypothetical protein